MTRGQVVALTTGLVAGCVLAWLCVTEPIEREIRRTLRCIRGGKR